MAYVCAVLMTAFYILYITAGKHGKSKRTVSILKIVPTSCAFVLSLTGGGGAYGCLVSAGLLLCVLADWVLDYRFVPGTALFGAAHLMFISAFLLKGRLTFLSAIVFLLAAAAFACLLSRKRTRKSSLGLLPSCAYCLALCCLLASSVNVGILCVSGAILFTVSDTLLGLRLFFDAGGKLSGWFIMGTYYGALFLISLSATII